VVGTSNRYGDHHEGPHHLVVRGGRLPRVAARSRLLAQRPLDDFPGFALEWGKFNALEITRGTRMGQALRAAITAGRPLRR
jgi:hypothetical protein